MNARDHALRAQGLAEEPAVLSTDQVVMHAVVAIALALTEEPPVQMFAPEPLPLEFRTTEEKDGQ